MALELPASFPIRAKTFKIMHKQQVTAAGAGFIQTIDRANPMWYCEYQTAPMPKDGLSYAGVAALLDQLEGAMNSFLGYDPTRPKPLYYLRNGGTPPATTLVDIEWDNSRIQLSGLPAGRLTVGDYVSYQYGVVWRLYRCISDLDGSGWVSVKPRPIEHGDLPITVRLVRPCAEMRMMGDFEESDTVDSHPTFRWAGFQFINRAVG